MRYRIQYLKQNDDGNHSVFEVTDALSVQCYLDGSEVFNSEGVVIRREVMKFAEAMECKLQENERKGGWKEMSPKELLGRIDEELTELKQCRSRFEQLGEAADVANFLMMLCDVCGLLDAESAWQIHVSVS